jgi:flagellar motor switch protein FliN/FliY
MTDIVDTPPLDSPLVLGPGVPDSLLRIPVTVQVVIGGTRLPLSRIAQLAPGTIIALDERLGAPATILVNGREVARGELFVLDGEEDGDRLGITITDVIEPGKPERG